MHSLLLRIRTRRRRRVCVAESLKKMVVLSFLWMNNIITHVNHSKQPNSKNCMFNGRVLQCLDYLTYSQEKNPAEPKVLYVRKSHLPRNRSLSWRRCSYCRGNRARNATSYRRRMDGVREGERNSLMHTHKYKMGNTVSPWALRQKGSFQVESVLIKRSHEFHLLLSGVEHNQFLFTWAKNNHGLWLQLLSSHLTPKLHFSWGCMHWRFWTLLEWGYARVCRGVAFPWAVSLFRGPLQVAIVSGISSPLILHLL